MNSKVDIFLVLALVLVACTPTSNKKVGDDRAFCEKELSLLVASGDSIHFNLDLIKFGQNYEEYLFGLVESGYDSFRCNIMFQADSLTSFPVSIFFPYLSDSGNAINSKKICNVLVNWENQIMVNGIVCPSDSVKYVIKEFYLKSDIGDSGIQKKFNSYLSFAWDQNAKQQVVKESFSGLIDGYLSVTNSISRLSFGVMVCDLNNTQIEELRSIIPFQLIVESTYYKKK